MENSKKICENGKKLYRDWSELVAFCWPGGSDTHGWSALWNPPIFFLFIFLILQYFATFLKSTKNIWVLILQQYNNGTQGPIYQEPQQELSLQSCLFTIIHHCSLLLCSHNASKTQQTNKYNTQTNSGHNRINSTQLTHSMQLMEPTQLNAIPSTIFTHIRIRVSPRPNLLNSKCKTTRDLRVREWRALSQWLKSGSSSYQCRHRTHCRLTVTADPRGGGREEPTLWWRSPIPKSRGQKAGAKATKRAKMRIGGRLVHFLRWREHPGCPLMRRSTSGISLKPSTMVKDSLWQTLKKTDRH